MYPFFFLMGLILLKQAVRAAQEPQPAKHASAPRVLAIIDNEK